MTVGIHKCILSEKKRNREILFRKDEEYYNIVYLINAVSSKLIGLVGSILWKKVSFGFVDGHITLVD